MFVHNAPLAIAFSKPHREPEFQTGVFAVLDVIAVPYGRCRGHTTTRRNLHPFKIESDGPCLHWVESLPGCHIGIQSTRQKRRWYIEHQNVRVMVRANPRQVSSRTAFAHWAIISQPQDTGEGLCGQYLASAGSRSGQFCSPWAFPRDSATIGIRRSVSLRVKTRYESVIAQTIIVGVRYCPNMKKYLALVLLMLFTAGAFAQPYRHHRHHHRYHHHVVVIRHHHHHYDHHQHALIAVQ